MRLFYNIFLFLFRMGVQVAALWNEKARLWLDGRKNIFRKMKQGFDPAGAKVVWMHCASLGEFEQGRPLAEALKERYQGLKLVITFFSPSGYEIRKNYKEADAVFYLPMDSPSHAAKFLDLVRPDIVLFIKYEYWYYYLTGLKKRNIPVLLVSGLFRKSQPFFKFYGPLHRRMLHCFTYFFVQNETSKELLESLNFKNVLVSGDTRFDRVGQLPGNFQPLDLVEKFCGMAKVIVAGSTWPADEAELDHYANTNPDIKFIIAPHDISESHLKEIESLFKNSSRYSELEKNHSGDKPQISNPKSQIPNLKSLETKNRSQNSNHEAKEKNVLIIDNVGMLSRLYHYATIAFVGGAFTGNGLHNILEPAAHGKPVLFGPYYEKFPEALELLDEGGAFTVGNAPELEEMFNRLFNDAGLLKKSGEASENYIQKNRGTTERILKWLQEKRLLTN